LLVFSSFGSDRRYVTHSKLECETVGASLCALGGELQVFRRKVLLVLVWRENLLTVSTVDNRLFVHILAIQVPPFVQATKALRKSRGIALLCF
jgi:hypothetical protein